MAGSALQILGDSLYAIKDDTKPLIGAARASGFTPPAIHEAVQHFQ